MGRPWSIHHVNDIRLTRGGHWEGGAQVPEQHTSLSVQALCRSFGLTTLVWLKLLILTSKKLAFKFSSYVFEYQPFLPYIHLASLVWYLLPGLPCFRQSSAFLYLWTQMEGKNEGGLETGLYKTNSWIYPIHRSDMYHSRPTVSNTPSFLPFYL